MQFGEIPICIIFKALGIETDKEIIKLITYDMEDTDIINIFKKSFIDANVEVIKNETTEQSRPIINQEDAINYLMQKVKENKAFSTTS